MNHKLSSTKNTETSKRVTRQKVRNLYYDKYQNRMYREQQRAVRSALDKLEKNGWRKFLDNYSLKPLNEIPPGVHLNLMRIFEVSEEELRAHAQKKGSQAKEFYQLTQMFKPIEIKNHYGFGEPSRESSG